jgi:hypothetical protein
MPDARKRKRRTDAAQAAWSRAGRSPWHPIRWYRRRNPRAPRSLASVEREIGHCVGFNVIVSRALGQPEW